MLAPSIFQQHIALQRDVLLEDRCSLRAQATLGLCVPWFDHYREVVAGAQLQQGEVSHYRGRRLADPQFHPDRSLVEAVQTPPGG